MTRIGLQVLALAILPMTACSKLNQLSFSAVEGANSFGFNGVSAASFTPDGKVVISWGAPTGGVSSDAVSYEIYLQSIGDQHLTDRWQVVEKDEADAPAGNGTLLQTVKAQLSYKLDTTLTTGAYYALQVRAIGPHDLRETNNRVLILRYSNSGLIFAGLMSENVAISEDRSKIDLSWEAAENNIGSVEYVVYGDANFSTMIGSTGGLGYTFANPEAGKPYVFAVRAKDALGFDGNTQFVIVSVPDTSDKIPPEFDGIVSATALSDKKITLTWNQVAEASDPAHAGERYRYNIYNSEMGTKVASVTASTYTATGLSPGTTYTFNVKVQDGTGNEDHNEVEKSATTLSYDVPSFNGLTSVDQLSGVEGLTQLKLSWPIAGGDVTGYRVYVAETSGAQDFSAPVEAVGFTSNAITGPYIAGVSTQSAIVNGLKPDTTYHFVVRAFRFAGDAVFSELNLVEKSQKTLSLAQDLPAPSISAVSPSFGSPAGGTVVAVSGSNFIPNIKATIGGSSCGDLTYISPTQFTCKTPAHAAGAVAAAVTNIDEKTGSLSNAFNYTTLPAPAISNVSPASGPPAGATLITITGTNFTAGATVGVGSGNCTSVTVVSSSSITCRTPAQGTGSADVFVKNSDTQSTAAADAFTYQDPPAPTGISPTIAVDTGGTTVTISGTGFLTDATVFLGGVNCTSANVVSATSITCITGAHAIGLVGVVVNNVDGQGGTLTNGFTYTNVAGPTVTSLTPGAGNIVGGTPITITGTGFVAGASVKIGGSSCSVGSLSSTQIACTTSAHASGQVHVVVTNPDTQAGTLSNGYTYTSTAAPTVTTVTPAVGAIAGSTSIAIGGTGFLAGASVAIGGVSCTSVNVVSYNQINCTTGAHSTGTVDVVVTNSDTQLGTLTSGFHYTSTPAPGVTSLSPTYGPPAGGSSLLISGTNFAAGSTVKIGGSPCTSPTVNSSTSISCVSPAKTAGYYDVVVTNSDTQMGTLSNGFLYLGPVTATSSLPVAGALAGGTTVTVNGTNFVPGTAVTLGGAACGSVTIVSSTQLTCVTGAHTAATVDIIITNPDATTATLTNAYTYQPAPFLIYVTPHDTASTSGGTTVTVSGRSILNGAVVKVDGTDCLLTTFVSSTSITCVTPPKGTGTYDVTVVNPDTQSFTLKNSLTYGTLTWTQINRVAGGRAPVSYNDGTGSQARFGSYGNMVSDGTNLYVIDVNFCVIRKVVIATGVTTTVAGSPSDCSQVDAVGTSARLQNPNGYAYYDGTYVYFTESSNYAIRRFNPSDGLVETVGNAIDYPLGITGDGGSNIYFTTSQTHAVYAMDTATWTRTLLAGDSTSGATDATGASARFNTPRALEFDSGNIYVLDALNYVIRKIVVATGVVSTLAGTLGAGPGHVDSGTAASVRFDYRSNGSSGYEQGLSSDGTSLFVGEFDAGTIRKITLATGATSTITTKAAIAVDGASSATARTKYPAKGITVIGGYVYFRDSVSDYSFVSDNSIRRLNLATGGITTIAGETGLQPDIPTGTGLSMRFNGWNGSGTMLGDKIYFGSGTSVKTYDITAGTMTELAGIGGTDPYSWADGVGSNARFSGLLDAATDGTSIFLPDSNVNALRKVDIASGTTTIIASAVNFGYPRGVATDGTYVYVVSWQCNNIRKVTLADSSVTVLAGDTGCAFGSTDAVGTSARFAGPTRVVLVNGFLYVAEYYNHTIRKVDVSNGTTTTLAGLAGVAGSTDGTGSGARFSGPASITSDGTNLYVGEPANNRIRKIVIATGVVTTIAGSGSGCRNDSSYVNCDIDGPLPGNLPGGQFSGWSVAYGQSKLYVIGPSSIRAITP